MSAPNNVLASRDINTSISPSKSLKAKSLDENRLMHEKPKTMEYHRQVLKSKMEEDEAKKAYISPSDTIMSPCTAKLSAYKNKHFMKAKPQSLFAKTSNKNVASTAAKSASDTNNSRQELNDAKLKTGVDA